MSGRLCKSLAPPLAMAAALSPGCGGAVVSSASSAADAAALDSSAVPDARLAGSDADVISDAAGVLGDEVPMPADATTIDKDVATMGSGMVVSGDDAAKADAPAGVDATSQCECRILDMCCAHVSPPDSAVACRGDVASADEAACRNAILQDRYGCLAFGFVPRCSAADEALCPKATLPCSRCLTAIQDCGDVIQCRQDPTCSATLDAVFACDEQGRSFQDCFNILAANGSVPGDLVLRGAMCGETCRGDP